MPRKKKPPLSFVERMRKLQAAQLKEGGQTLDANIEIEYAGLEDLQMRVKRILGITDKIKKNAKQNALLRNVRY